MKLNKRHYAIVICGVSLLAKPALALWPVFDFTEIIPVNSEISTVLDGLRQAKSQKDQLNQGLAAIGSSAKTIASYGQDFSTINNGIKESSGQSANTVNNNLNNNKNAVGEVSGTLGNTQNSHQGLTGQFVDQTENILNNRGYSHSQLQLHSEIKLAFLENISIEEEEEEEEVTSTDSLKDDILLSFDSFKEENDQIRIETNDMLDLTINNLNSSAKINQKAFEDLKNALAQTDKLSPQNKNDLQEEIETLAKKEQKLSEWGIDIVESAKESYNRQYKEKIEDGLNNYKKVIIAYLNGNAERADITAVGNEFKINAASINAAPDVGVIKKYQQETVMVQNELSKLKEEIEKIAEN
ncbi:MAG: hypothetical protein J6C85_01815 [Alphaproteobacteria bacterium]|nr:hypothetical protein [Alphaproteobacteria bacterium]